MPFSPLEMASAVVIITFAAVVQGSVGMGFNIIAVPLTLLIDPRLAPVPMLFVSVVLTSLMVMREPAHVDLKGTGWILAGRVPGVFLGLLLLAAVTPATLNVVIGLVVVLGVVAMAFGPPLRRNRPIDLGAGMVSGAASVVSAIGGPAVGMLYKDEHSPTIRATLGTVFTIGAIISLMGRAFAGRITATDLQLALIYLPAIVIGFATSTVINRRFVGARYRTPILVLSAIAAMALLLRSLL